MQEYRQQDSPFDKKIPVNSAVTWLQPKLVAEVKFTEMTRDGILRHPVFLHLREDKPPAEVKPEPEIVPAPPSSSTSHHVKAKAKNTKALA